MNDVIRKYVNAYMNGEMVEYRYKNPEVWNNWHGVDRLADFSSDKDYRIKPGATKMWQYIVKDINKLPFMTSQFFDDDMPVSEDNEWIKKAEWTMIEVDNE